MEEEQEEEEKERRREGGEKRRGRKEKKAGGGRRGTGENEVILKFSKFSHVDTVIKDEQGKHHVKYNSTEFGNPLHLHSFLMGNNLGFANCFYLVLFYPLCANGGAYPHTGLYWKVRHASSIGQGPCPHHRFTSPMQQMLAMSDLLCAGMNIALPPVEMQLLCFLSQMRPTLVTRHSADHIYLTFHSSSITECYQVADVPQP